MSKRNRNLFQLCGWILFVLSALFFIASSIRAGDPISLLGGILFLLACFVFMWPLLIELGISLNSSSLPRTDSRYRSGWSRAAHCLSRAPDAPRTLPMQPHHQAQNRLLQDRLALRFYASTR